MPFLHGLMLHAESKEPGPGGRAQQGGVSWGAQSRSWSSQVARGPGTLCSPPLLPQSFSLQSPPWDQAQRQVRVKARCTLTLQVTRGRGLPHFLTPSSKQCGLSFSHPSSGPTASDGWPPTSMEAGGKQLKVELVEARQAPVKGKTSWSPT